MRASGLRGQIMEVTVWLHSHFWTSLATKQRPQKAWRVNSRRPRKGWDPTFQLPENCYALFFWNTLEDNGKENIPFEQGWFNQSRHRRVSNTGRRTDDHHNILRWYNELLKVENRSSSESVMIITGQRERQTATEFLSVLSGVFSVLQKQPDLTLCKPWLESWIFNAATTERSPFPRLSSAGNNKDKEDYGIQCPEWTGAVQAHTPLIKPDHLHSLPGPTANR